MELTNPTSTPLPSWASELIPDLHDAICSGGGHHDHAAWCALEVLQRRGLLVQSEPEGEAGELVKDLRECADSCTLAEKHGWARVMRRAAEVLARWGRLTIKPVPVAERRPGPEDVDWLDICKGMLHDFDDLVANSDGVSGLHRNGDLATWDELTEGSDFLWTGQFARAREAINALPLPATH